MCGIFSYPKTEMTAKISRNQDVPQALSIRQPVFSTYLRLGSLTILAPLSLDIKARDVFPEEAERVHRTKLWWCAHWLMDLLM